MQIPRLPCGLSALCSVLLAVCLIATPASRAGDTEHWSMGPLGGTFQIVPGSHMLTVQSVPAGTPAAAAGLQPGDRILGAFGEDFRPINNYFTGSVQDFGSAIDRAEGTGGSLPVRVLRPGVGVVNLTATLPAAGYFGPAFPLGSPKFDTLYETSCAQVHAGASSWFGGAAMSPTNGSLTNLGWMGLLMLSHPNWADTSGARPYRNSINIMRNQAVAVLNNIVLAPVKSGQPGYVDPGLENWQITAMTMFLGEYVNRTGDTSVMPTLQRACDALANRIQQNGSHDGHMGHGGVEGDYGNWGLHIINVHTHTAFAFAKRAGATINQAKWGLSWNQLKGSTARSNGHPEDGYVEYGPGAWGQGSGWDASARTPGTYFSFYNYGQTPTADDTDALTRMKNYVVRNHERFQIAHAYTVGGVGFTHFALPYFSDREQRHILDNLRYFYQFHRTANPNSLAYFGGRGNNGGDSYLNFDRVKLYNAAFAMAVFNGGLPSVPGVNPNRILAHMKSPWTRWPTLEAKTATLAGLNHHLDVEITDWRGAPMTTGFTAAWSRISGPGTVTFGNPVQPSTSVAFSSGGRHRLQLTATAGGYTVTELYDFDVMAAPTPGGFVAGVANWELFSGVSGTTVASLTGHPSFPSAPAGTGTVASLDLPHRGDNYGQRVTGVIIPPASGSYRFFIASDDSSQFRFNTAGPQEGGSVICSVAGAVTAYNWTAQANQQSALFNLTAGQPYYFEILHKEGTGADHCAVAWTGPGIASPTVIGAESIAAPDRVEILRQPVSRIAIPGGTANFDLLVRGPGPFLYEWRLDGVAYWGQSTNPALSVPNIGPSAAGQYTCVITTPSGVLVSAPATLSLSTTPQNVPGLLREVWTGMGGSTVADLTGSARFPRFPDITGVVTSAETPQNFADSYGQRLSGWVVPPVTGSYRFYLSSDDASQLWLSSNHDPANKTLRAQITGWTNYRTYSASSASITLTAGQRYYIEILHKEGGGGDHLSLAWQVPGGSVPATGSAPIPGEFLECEINSADPLSTGLVAWWRMDDAAGATAIDSTSTAADGAVNGATWTNGRRLGGLQLSGAQSVHCGRRASLSGTTPFTLTAWVRVNAGTSQQGTIIQQRAGDGFNGQYRFYVSNTGRLGFYVYGNSAEQFNFTGNTAINNGNWHHVAAVRDASGNAYLYLNGVLDGSVTGTTQRSLSSSISVGIGADIRDSVNFFRGTLDDIRIYSRVLSPAEISQIRNRAPQITPSVIDLGLIPAGQPFTLDLAPYASDPDIGETITWQKLGGPAWLGLNANGTASGVPAAADAGPNTFTIRATDSLGAAADATINANVVVVGPAPAVVTVAAAQPQVWENGGAPAVFVFTRDLTAGPLSVAFSLSGTATAGVDYLDLGGLLTFADGSSSASLELPLINDSLNEGTETIVLTLGSGAGYVSGTPATATVEILDDDGPQPVSDPWSAANIGNVAAGNASSVIFGAGGSGSDVFSLTGSGTLGQNTTSDGFRFVSMPVPGDCEIIARVVTNGTSGNAMRAGVMIRESSAANSRHAAMVLRGTTRTTPAWFIRRTTTGGNSARTESAGVAAPHWVRIRRSGNTFAAAISADGTAWTNVGSAQSIAMGETPLVGLAVASGSTSSTNTANFDNVVIRQPLTVTAGPGGTAGGGGWHPRFSEAAITATPSAGHRFVAWAGTGIDDPASPSTTALIDSAKTVTANFAVLQYTATYQAGPNGTITGTSPQTIDHGAAASPVTAVPDPGYHFVAWSDGITTPERADTNLTADLTVTANFEILAADSYDDWTEHHQLRGDDADPLADPDRDGMTNLMEFALDLNPIRAEGQPVTATFHPQDGQSYLALTIPRNPASVGRVTITAEFASDVGGDDWSAAGTVIVSETPGSMVVRDSVSLNDVPRRFGRVRVTMLP